MPIFTKIRFSRPPLPMIAVLLFAGVGAVIRVQADETDSAQQWPTSWFKPPHTASELGIDKFKQSPMLTERVARGEIPSVEHRLPDDPVVMQPYERPGQYGGTLRTISASLLPFTSPGSEPPLIMGPNINVILPNLAKGWEYRDDGKTLRLFLRPGLKWSDGAPHTADDYIFWHKYYIGYKELTPVRPAEYDFDMVKVDDYTVDFKFDQPAPYFINYLAHWRGAHMRLPAHFLKRYHPEFTPLEQLEAEAKKQGYMTWRNYFGAASGNAGDRMWETPTLAPFVISQKSPMVNRYARNPYYWKIDSHGRQLPYIDEVKVVDSRNEQVLAAQVATGQIDFAAAGLNTQDIPLYKAGEEVEPYRTLIWDGLFGAMPLIQFNLNHPDARLRSIFQDFRFRQAISLAINREELNNVVFFGHAQPSQTTVLPTSRFYDPEFANAYIEYNPERARKLLDEMGMQDVNDDGTREAPDGQPLVITLDWYWEFFQTPLELLREHWREVGVNIRLKQVNRDLQIARAAANQIEMMAWISDRRSDLLFPILPFWFVPTQKGWERCMWNHWCDWYISNGEAGETPPPEVRKLVEWYDDMISSPNEDRRIELGRKILRSQAKNLWTVGTLGTVPVPVVVSERLHNVPERAYTGWDNLFFVPYKPSTWFFE